MCTELIDAGRVGSAQCFREALRSIETSVNNVCLVVWCSGTIGTVWPAAIEQRDRDGFSLKTFPFAKTVSFPDDGGEHGCRRRRRRRT